MKRILIILGIIGGVLVAAAVLIMLQMRSGSPEMLLAKLAKGRGDKEELIMRLNMARGDVVPPMIAAFQNNSHPSKFRAEVLELLAKKNLRTNKSEIEQVLMKALKDSDVVIRRKAAYCAAVYGPDHLRLVLVENVEDPDVHIRQNIYQLLYYNKQIQLQDRLQLLLFLNVGLYLLQNQHLWMQMYLFHQRKYPTKILSLRHLLCIGK